MGIHLAIDNPTLDAHHPQEIREMRVRLYWSGKWSKLQETEGTADDSVHLGQDVGSRYGP